MKTLQSLNWHSKNIAFVLVLLIVSCSDNEEPVRVQEQSVHETNTITSYMDVGKFINADIAASAHGSWQLSRYGKIDDSQPRAVVFGRNKIEELLASCEECAGIRLYFTRSIDKIDGELVEHDDVVLIPIDKNGKDLIDIYSKVSAESAAPIDHTKVSSNVKVTGEEPIIPNTPSSLIVNASLPCPDHCN
ncbi:MAG: hypothetical protein L0Y35_04285 [Flammeovirgaceae bacterium]|nr:hypothetical protein [Flammeovirgaceae bacterium]